MYPTTLPEQLQKELKNNETVLWEGVPSLNLFYSQVGFVAAFGVFIASGILAVIYSQMELFLGGLIGVFSITGYSLRPYQEKKKETRYFVTDYRIVICREGKMKSLFYEEIFKIEPHYGEKKIVFYDKPDSISKHSIAKAFPYFSGLDNVGDVFRTIKEAAGDKGPFNIIYDRMKEFSSHYGLKLETSGAYKNSKITRLVGEIDEIPFVVEIIGSLPVKSLIIHAKCNNPNDHFLYINRESLLDNVGKLFGVQDLQVGERNFDTTFLLQSDDVDFFKAVLEKEVQAAMLETEAHHTGSYQLGKKRELSPSIRNEKVSDKDDDVLDLHLITRPETIGIEAMIGEEERTTLTYTCSFYSYQAENPMHIANAITYSMNSTILLAKAIDEYRLTPFE